MVNSRLNKRAEEPRRTQPQRGEIDPGPSSIYEAVTRSMVENLADDVREIRNRITGLFWLLAGTVAIDFVLRVLGMGK